MSLTEIRQQIINHPTNAWAKALSYEPVYSVSENSRIIIVGQAPGRKAQESLTPWNDVSGDTLRKWLNLSREEFYDTSKLALIPMDFFYPGKGVHGDLPPRADFAPKWHPKILKEMPNVKLFLLVGSYAQKYYLRKDVGRNLTETVRAFNDYLPLYLPLVHPSPLNFRWRSQNPWFEEQIVPVTKDLVHTILRKK